MQTDELLLEIEKFKSIKNYCDGVVGIDQIPRSMKIKHFLIVNTELSYERGQHWFCLVKVSKTKFEIFDSLGFTESKQTKLYNFLKFNQGSFIYNLTPFQNENSNSCGLFVLYFLVYRLHNFDLKFDDLLNEIFTENTSTNEQSVLEFKDSFLC